MEHVATAIANPFALAGFVVAIVFSTIFVKSKQAPPLKWAALGIALVAIVGGLAIGHSHETSSLSTSGSNSPIVTGVNGNVSINTPADPGSQPTAPKPKSTQNDTAITTTGNCSPVVSKAGGSVTISCTTYTQDQLTQLNSLVRDSDATRQAVAKIIELLDRSSLPAESRIASAESYALEIKSLNSQVSHLKDDLAKERARKALQAGDVKGASEWVKIASQISIDNVIKTRSGELIIGDQSSSLIHQPVAAFNGKLLNLPVEAGQSFRYQDDFGVQQIDGDDVLLFAMSGGGTACPSNYAIIDIGASIWFYDIGNCNEEIEWKRISPDRMDIFIPRSGSGKEDGAQKIQLRPGELGVLRLFLNGKVQQYHDLGMPQEE